MAIIPRRLPLFVLRSSAEVREAGASSRFFPPVSRESLWILRILMMGLALAAPIAGIAADPATPPEFFLNGCWSGITCLNFAQVAGPINLAMIGFAALIFLAVFLIGAFLLVISAGRDTLVQNGKSMMIGSLIGTALVFGAYSIYRTTVFLLYSG